MAKVLGIDLGTTSSVMAVLEGGTPTILENAEGSRLTPSVVAVNPRTGQTIVGQAARRQALTNPEHTVFSGKRLLARNPADLAQRDTLGNVPYAVRTAQSGAARVLLGGKEYTPTVISAMILRKLKQDAEAKLGEPVTRAVVTVPASFDDNQRHKHPPERYPSALELVADLARAVGHG